MATNDPDRTPNLTPLAAILLAIALVGALNWGLIGIFDWNLVDAVFGGGPREATSTASRVVYAVVGLSALALLPLLFVQRREPINPV